MDKDKAENLRQKLADLWAQAQALEKEAEDIPAFARNSARLRATINMMVIDLGGSVLAD